ncbi:MAG: bacteriocin [Candidatus Omnitrophota bacterium]
MDQIVFEKLTVDELDNVKGGFDIVITPLSIRPDAGCQM